ncbi:MAG: GNAT family N-acetyltransferase [Roseibium sp.]
MPYPYDLEAGRAYLERAAGSWSDQGKADALPFHIDHDGQMIGGLSFKKLHETPEIGYWLGRPYWGKGYMSEAVTAAIGWLFQNTEHTRVTSEAMIEHPASLNVMEKLGFRLVGEVGCASASRGLTMPAIRTELLRTDFLTGL